MDYGQWTMDNGLWTMVVDRRPFPYLCQSNSNFMGILKQVAEYLYLRKKDPDAPNSKFVKYMHGINRLSIFLFIIGIILLLIKIFSSRG